ncbi:AfaD family invasin [Pantoea sp. SIMBA_133]
MKNRKAIYLLTAALSACNVTGTAADNIQIVLQAPQKNLAGAVSDGTRLGKGALISCDDHRGFQLYGAQTAGATTPGHYVLTGSHNPSNQLRVRLYSQKPLTTEQDGAAVSVNTLEDKVVFDIVADGNQWVRADSYTLNIYGALLPE